MTRRKLLQGGPDAGVSVIVGAILLTGIVLGAIVTVRLTFVPVWEEDTESQHMDEVAKKMAELTSDINRRVDNTSTTPLSVSIPMVATGGNNPFSTSRASGTLEFNPGTSPLEIDSPSILLQSRNGTDLAGVNETWDQVGSGNNIENATEILNLRINVTGPACQGTTDNCFDQMDNVKATIIDKDGNFAGDLTVYMDNPPGSSTGFLGVRVRAPTTPPTVVFNNSVLSFQQTDWNPPYWVNTLNDDYRFDRLLDAAKAPYRVELTENGLEGTFSATYLQSVSGGGGAGTKIVGGGGIESEAYKRDFTSGTLAFESANNEYVNQRYVIENGALVLNQSDGAVFKVEPPIDMIRTGQTAIVNLGLPTLQGESSSLAGSRSGRVQVATSSSEEITGALGDLNLTFHTAYPDLWERHLQDQLDDAGFPEPAAGACPPTSDPSDDRCEYELTSNNRRVKLVLHGPTDFEATPTDPSVRDISMRFNAGRIQTVIR